MSKQEFNMLFVLYTYIFLENANFYIHKQTLTLVSISWVKFEDTNKHIKCIADSLAWQDTGTRAPQRPLALSSKAASVHL